MRMRRRRSRGGRDGREPRPRIGDRERRVLELSEQGWTQVAIAGELGISQPAVSKILARIDARLEAEIATDAQARRMRIIRHLEYVSRESRRAWEQSKTGRVRRRQRQAAGGDGTADLVQEVMIDQSPDPRLLEQARRAEAHLAQVVECVARPAEARERGRGSTEPPADSVAILARLSPETLERLLRELGDDDPPSADAGQ